MADPNHPIRRLLNEQLLIGDRLLGQVAESNPKRDLIRSAYPRWIECFREAVLWEEEHNAGADAVTSDQYEVLNRHLTDFLHGKEATDG